MPEDRLIGYPPNSANALHKRGKNYLLVIGIDKYEDTHIPTLRNAVRDTERLIRVLTTKYGFQLLRKLHDEKATRRAVLLAIEELETQLKPEDNLVIFFSGHGYRKNNGGFIVPFDGHNDRTADYIANAPFFIHFGLLLCRFCFEKFGRKTRIKQTFTAHFGSK
jgi:uncharacterized caspase-like protein